MYKEKNESIFHFCQERRGWWCIQLDALIVLSSLLGVLGLGLAIYAISNANIWSFQGVINTSGTLAPSVVGVYITTNSPVVLSLPRDLTDYIGKTYNVDCALAAGHKVQIAPGGAVWDAALHTVATCSTANSGLTFRVVAKDKIRVISSINVAFT
jgi:hypothetical protein